MKTRLDMAATMLATLPPMEIFITTKRGAILALPEAINGFLFHSFEQSILAPIEHYESWLHRETNKHIAGKTTLMSQLTQIQLSCLLKLPIVQIAVKIFDRNDLTLKITDKIHTELASSRNHHRRIPKPKNTLEIFTERTKLPPPHIPWRSHPLPKESVIPKRDIFFRYFYKIKCSITSRY